MARKWIAGAIKRKGQLHRDLGIPLEEKIPVSRIRAAAKKKGKVGMRARLALTLGKLRKGRKRQSPTRQLFGAMGRR